MAGAVSYTGLLISRRLGSSAGVGSGCVILANLQFTSPPAFSRDRSAAGSRAICALTGRGVKDCNITREQRTENRARQRRAGETHPYMGEAKFHKAEPKGKSRRSQTLSGRILAGLLVPEPKTSLKCSITSLVSGTNLRSLEQKITSRPLFSTVVTL